MPPSQRAKVNFDHPESLETSLLCQHLDALRLGSIVQIPTYCFAEHARLDETIQMSPSNVVFVDGVLVLSEPALRSKFDFSVYVHTDDRVRLQRRIDRDVVDRGRTPGSVVDQWNESVMPMHRQFVEPSRQFADCEIQNNDDSLPEIDRIVEKINSSL